MVKRAQLEILWAIRRRVARFLAPPVKRPEGMAGVVLPPVAFPSKTEAMGDDAFGYGYLQRWRSSERDLMAPAGPEETRLRLFSHNAPETPPATHPHVVVEANNLTIDFGRIGLRDDAKHRPGYLRTRGGFSEYLPGALIAAGRRLDGFGLDLFPRDHLRDIFDALEVTGSAPRSDETIDGLTLFMTREPREHTNLFHAHTDWLAAFMAVRLLGLEEEVTRIVLLDPNPNGSLDPGLRVLFSRRNPLARRADFGSRRVRFRHGVFVPPGYSSVLWARQHGDTSGPMVGLLVDYGRFVRAAFGVPLPDLPSPSPVRVTLLDRRPNAWGGGVLLRQFRSTAAIRDALRAIPGVIVEVVDPAAFSLTDQVRMAAQTEILVGAHGAGLSHALAMPEHGAVVEVVARPAKDTYRLYPNMAAWTGRLFHRFECVEKFGLRGSVLDPDVEELRRCVGALAGAVRKQRAGTRRVAPNCG